MMFTKVATVLAVAFTWLIVAAPALAQSADRQTATVTANAPIYIAAAVSTTPLRVAAPGTVLRVLQQEPDWIQVEFNDPQWGPRVGWVQRSLLSLSTEAPQPVAPPVPDTATYATVPRPVPEASSAKPSGVQGSKPKDVKIRGYVTAVTSSTEFEIEDYRIHRDDGFSLDLENADPDIRFQLADIRVGVELEIEGLWYPDTGVLKATSIKVDLEQFKPLKHEAVITRMPERREGAIGQAGVFYADGQRIRVAPQTQVLFAMTKREKQAAKNEKKKPQATLEDEAQVRPLKSLDEVSVGMLMKYEGRRDPKDGVILAERLEFSHNDLEDGEKKMWASLKTEVTPANAQQLSPGELKIHDIGKFKTIPDAEVQAYVERIGASLIPTHQRDLSTSDPSKIPFQFHVVVDKTPNAFATPNGIVVVHSGLFSVLENEAQLAFILSHEVSHAVQEHSWRQTQHLKVRRGLLKVGAAFAAAYGQYDVANLASMFEGALRNGYSRSLENQADRMGLEGMVAAGYDPRQAPQSWKALTRTVGDSSTDWFWSTHDNNATRRSYLMNELKNNYADLNYDSLRVEAEPFAEMATKAKAASTGKQKVKIR